MVQKEPRRCLSAAETLLVLLGFACSRTGLASTGGWVELSPTGAKPSARGWHVLAVDPDNRKLYLHGGWAGTGTQGFEDFWSYHIAADTWTQLSPGATPLGARERHAGIYDRASGRLLLHGGWDGIEVRTDLWAYDVASNTWSQISAIGPLRQADHVAVLHEASRSFFVHGGWQGQGAYHSQMWSYDLNNGTWNRHSPTTGSIPDGRKDHVAVVHQATSIIYIHGGDVSGVGVSDDLWSYDIGADRWTQLFPSGPRPSARHQHAAIFDEASGTLLLHGGKDQSAGRLSDLWSYDVAAGTWSLVVTLGVVPEARYYHSTVWDPVAGVMYLQGGWSGQYVDDLWALTTTTSTTTTTTTTTTCQSGWVPGAAGDPCEQCAADTFAGPGGSCEPCPPGHASAAGADACLQRLASVLAGLSLPALTTWTGSGTAQLNISLSAVPAVVFEGSTLQYAIDVAATEDSLTGSETACSSLWQVSATSARLEHTYSEFDGPCTLNSNAAEASVRDGVVGIYLVADDSGTKQTVQQWRLSVMLDFSTETTTATATTTPSGRGVALSAYRPSLSCWQIKSL